MRAIDTLVEAPQSFEIENKSGEKETLHLYPLQLGRLMMITRRLLSLDLVFDDERIQDSVQQIWQICAQKAHEVAEIIAISTLRTKEEIETKLQERKELIEWSPTMTQQALTNVLFTIVGQSYYADFVSAIRSVRTLRAAISPTTQAERIADTEEQASGDN